MVELTTSLKYIIELTEAYKNDFITKEEYKGVRASEIFFIVLRISKLKEFSDIILYTSMYAMTVKQMNVMIAKPKFPKGYIEYFKGK